MIMNLCTNAYQAMRARGGTLQVTLEAVQVDAAMAAAYLDLPEGPYLRLNVSDNGPGMAPAIRERIFEPYFTTKRPGEGTGLGLAVVHGIVTSLGGAILVRSQPGRGATFSVYLHRLERQVQLEESSAAPIPRGDEHVLLVDDEPQITHIFQRMLEHLGYRITVKTDSTEALAAFAERPQEFDLVISDLAMPHLSGIELAARMMLLRPGIPIILCTGFGEPEAVERARRLGIREFLQKPLSARDLAQTMRRVLDRRPGEEAEEWSNSGK